MLTWGREWDVCLEREKSQCSKGPWWPVRRAGCGKPSLAPERKHDTRNDLLSNLPSLLFFLPLIVNIPSLLKLASQLKLNTDSEPSNHFGVFFLLTPHQQLGWHAFEQTKSDFTLLVFRAFWLNAEWEIHTFFKQCGFFFPVPLIHLVLWRSWNPGKC